MIVFCAKEQQNYSSAQFYEAVLQIRVVVGTDGIIIVDTTEAQEPALQILKEFRKITSKPIKAIILTHFHTGNLLLELARKKSLFICKCVLK